MSHPDSEQRMHIGILTYHYVGNEGAIWQAFALCSYLRSRFPQHQVDIVDYCHASKAHATRQLQTAVLREAYDTTLEAMLSDTHIESDRPQDLFDYLGRSYGGVIVGSDIIWQFNTAKSLLKRLTVSCEKVGDLNPSTDSLYRFLQDVKNWGLRIWRNAIQSDPMHIPFPNVYWLTPSLPCRTATFAASVGYSNVSAIPAQQAAEMKTYLRALDVISVRDRTSLRFVREIAPDRADDVLLTPDPTWLFGDPLPDISDLWDSMGLDPARKVAGVLFPKGSFYGKRLQRWIFPMLREKGYQIAAVIDANPNADIDFVSEVTHPFAWWAIIQRLDFLVTVRTHPTIAALKYETPFANFDITAMYNRSTHSKSQDMLSVFGLSDCCMYRRRDFTKANVCNLLDSCLERAWDWERIGSVRRQNRQDCEEAVEKIGEALLHAD